MPGVSWITEVAETCDYPYWLTAQFAIDDFSWFYAVLD